MKNNLNPLYEGWFTNLFKGPAAKNLEEAKSLYIKDAIKYGKMGMHDTWINYRMKHFTNVINKYPNTKSIILPLLKRIQNIGKINNFEDYECVVVGFTEINVRLFNEFGLDYCDNTFKNIARKL